MEITAQKNVRFNAVNEKANIAAKNEVRINAGGSYIKINAGGIEVATTGNINTKGAILNVDSGSSSKYSFPKMPSSSPGALNPELNKRWAELIEIGNVLRTNGFTPPKDADTLNAIKSGNVGDTRFLVSIQKRKPDSEPIGYRRPDTGRTTMWTATFDMMKQGDLSAPLLCALVGTTFDAAADYDLYVMDQGSDHKTNGALTFSPTWENMQKFGPDELHKDDPKDPIRDKALLKEVMNEEMQKIYREGMEEFWSTAKTKDRSEYTPKDIEKYLIESGASDEEFMEFKSRHLYRTQIGTNAYFTGNGATEFVGNDKAKASVEADGIKMNGAPSKYGVAEILTIEKNPPSIAELEASGKVLKIPLT